MLTGCCGNSTADTNLSSAIPPIRKLPGGISMHPDTGLAESEVMADTGFSLETVCHKRLEWTERDTGLHGIFLFDGTEFNPPVIG